METLKNISLIGMTFTSFLLIIGIIRPSIAIWWNAKKTRVNVILTWGLSHAFFVAMYFIVISRLEDPIKVGLLY